MHDFYGIHEIKSKWEQKRPRCLPMPIPIIKQFFRESLYSQFSELSSIKNYFGEKTGFYFAFLSYYTSWLIIPAILGLALTIYQRVESVDTIFTGLYAILVCIWVTVFIERWKRKSAEISLKWGVLQYNQNIVKEVRDEFFGDEYFSHITH